MVEISYVKRDTANFCKGGVASPTGTSEGDREARSGLSYGLSDRRGSVAAVPSILGIPEDGDRESEYAGHRNFDG